MTSKLMEHAQEVARGSMADLGPDEDPMPTLVWVGPYGLGLMPCTPMGAPGQRDQLAGGMIAALVVGRATEAAFSSSSWMVEPRDNKPIDCAPSEHPDRREIVMVMYVGPTGGAMSMAPITRHPDRAPELGEWETEEYNKLGGRFGEALTKGLAMAQEMPPEMAQIIADGWALGEQEQLIRRFLKVYGDLTGMPVADIGVQVVGVETGGGDD